MHKLGQQYTALTQCSSIRLPWNLTDKILIRTGNSHQAKLHFYSARGINLRELQSHFLPLLALLKMLSGSQRYKGHGGQPCSF